MMSTVSKTIWPEELMRRFSDRAREKRIPPDERATWLLDLGWEIGNTGVKGVRFLLAQIASADDLRLRAILLGAAANVAREPGALHDEVCATALGFLADQRPLIVAEAVDALRWLKHRGARQRVLDLLKHSSPYVVGATLRYVAQLFPKKAAPLLEEALASPEQIVRQNAIDELDYMGHVQALPKIRPLLKDRNKWVRQAARTAVKNLEELEQE